MVYVQVCGGLGNQLFQYAYARALQEKGINVRLAANFYTKYRTKRTYELDHFRVQLKRSHFAENIVSKIADNDLPFKIRNRFIREYLQVGYNQNLLDIQGNCYMIGVFQSEKYFKSIEFQIRKELLPKRKINVSKDLKCIIKEKNTVSIHIRRGDYVSLNNTLPKEYYNKAIELIKEKVINPYFFVFSDDIEWVKHNYDFGEETVFISNNKMKDYEELLIMSKCRHNIIANSTFSWWAAWLNQNQDKIVIGPRKWNGQGNINIMPNEWIKV